MSKPFQTDTLTELTKGQYSTDDLKVELIELKWYVERNCEFVFKVEVGDEVRFDNSSTQETTYIQKTIDSKFSDKAKAKMSQKESYDFICKTYHAMIR